MALGVPGAPVLAPIICISVRREIVLRENLSRGSDLRRIVVRLRPSRRGARDRTAPAPDKRAAGNGAFVVPNVAAPHRRPSRDRLFHRGGTSAFAKSLR